MSWIARYEDYANCKKDITRGYGNIPRSTTRLLSLLQLTEDNQFFWCVTQPEREQFAKLVADKISEQVRFLYTPYTTRGGAVAA